MSELSRDLYPMIFKRKSFHLFRDVGDEIITDDEIREIYGKWNELLPLHPEIRTKIRIVPSEETTCKRGQQYCVLLYSENREGYLQNIGYLGEQLDLYLVSRNIGSLWFGIGRTEEPSYDGLEFVIMIAIRKVSENKFRKDMFKSKRKPAEEIWKGEQIKGVTDIIRFTPSACNSQPWIVKNENGILEVYRYKKAGKRGIMPADKVSFYNRIDIGIFMCFLELCLQQENTGYERTLFTDKGSDDDMNLNAEYVLES